MLYNKKAAQRILVQQGIDCKEVSAIKILKNVVLVQFVNSNRQKAARFVGFKAFKAEFARFRQEAGRELFQAGAVSESENGWLVESGSDVYEVEVRYSNGKAEVFCGCKDLELQKDAFGGGCCKHGYALLQQFGCDRLSQFVLRNQQLDQLLAA